MALRSKSLPCSLVRALGRLVGEHASPTVRTFFVIHVYEVQPRKDHRGVDLISDVLPFGRLWYGRAKRNQQCARLRQVLQSLTQCCELLVPTVLVTRVCVLVVTALVRRSLAAGVLAAVASRMPSATIVRPSRVYRSRKQEKRSKSRSD
jgi:hypothetical protein